MQAQRDRGINQPGAAGNRGGATPASTSPELWETAVSEARPGRPGVGDPGFNQPGAAGNVGRDPGINQPGAAGNVGRDPGVNQPGAAGNRRR